MHGMDDAVVTTLPRLVWIPLLPLLAFVVLIFTGRRLGRWSVWLSVAALAASCELSLSLAPHILNGQRVVLGWTWATAGPLQSIGFIVDGLSWVMLLVVTTIATAIAIYSTGYMRDDPRTTRFFAYLSLFCASMLGLVMADHFVLLYACWELVGLCSYLLISFWFEKPAAAAAGRKAFLTTRIGDTGLLLGILLLAVVAGELHVTQVETIRSHLLAHGQGGLLTLISALIFFGAVGKSAQFPLHVWLPDAMEGPTPVSALIHAATMVAAGVYLVARSFPLFTPSSLSLILVLGLITHLGAGTIALTMTDIKRVLAYSTISQLGLMMTALGLGAMPVAMFHLVTHAWFKALLFLGAGSVIHATHQQELERLGGLRRAMPWTAGCVLIAGLSMAGLFPLSGFWSKDAILLAARERSLWVFGALLIGAVMTSGYIARLYLRCFEGTPTSHGHHAPHESPAVMVGPMIFLTSGAALVGCFAHQPLFRLLGVPQVREGLDTSILVLSSIAAACGISLAWRIGVQHRPVLPRALRPLGHRLYTWAANTYYVDETYYRWVITPVITLTQRWAQFDLQVIDGMVNGTGRAGWAISQWKERCDRLVVDRVVNGTAATVRRCGALLRRVQTGVVQHYLLLVASAIVALIMVLR